MVENSIAARMEDYFQRQVQLFQRMADDGIAFPANAESSDWEEAGIRQAQFARELQALEEEFWLLKREWDESGDISPDTQARMQELAASALERAEKVARKNAENAVRVSEMMQDVRSQQAALQRGKRMLRNLRAGDPGDAGFMDRKV